MSDKALRMRALAEPARGFLFRGLCLFLPAWTFRFPHAWVFLAVALVAESSTRLYLIRTDPAAAERRQHAPAQAENRATQRSARSSLQMLSFVGLLVCALDYRFGWSEMPAAVVALGVAMVAGGLFVVFLAVRANTFASVLVTLHHDQAVVSDGPYGLVRHPMYSGLTVFMIGTPLALGSWWGLLVGVGLVASLAVRLIDEERFLAGNLTGYREYTQRVRHRLVPLVW